MSTYQPTIPPKVRTIAYYTALVVGALATGSAAITAAVAPEHAETVAAVAGAVSGIVATIAGGLGVVYRPDGQVTTEDLPEPWLDDAPDELEDPVR
ncbi:hypothetical protein GCM10009718_37020 [Isoptericola halotolerans]|uniref:Holin n=1 Tax=Isoptericola halotolerans TaxID=300560 RepID=A0ABX2A5U6_9MICO|nr:hypothetical protein [Isoptericola halotolerans]NOV98232.1 hypothetical protein [Isoptericola halotolerans]